MRAYSWPWLMLSQADAKIFAQKMLEFWKSLYGIS